MPKIPSRYYKKSKIEQLQSFCTVVETDFSVTHASEKLNLSPASVSTHIQSLEYDLGFKLFNRIKGRLHLTREGKKYYHKAKEGLGYIDSLYGKEEKEGYSKFDLFFINVKNKLINRIVVIGEISLRFIKKMFIKIKLQHLIAFLIFVTALFYYIYNKQLNNNFLEKSTAITKSIAKNIDDADNALNKSTSNTAILIREYFASHPKMNRGDLLKLKEQINDPTITIYDKNGYFYLTTSRAMDPKYEHYDHYKNLSVLKDKPSSKVLSTMQTCVKAHKYPNTIFVLPIYGRKVPYNNVTKNAILYDEKLDKIFDVSYSGKDIQQIIDKNFSLYKDITYISISDKHGNIIIEKGDEYKSHKKIEKYSEEVLWGKNKDSLILTMPFGGEKDVTEMTTNGDRLYFYVLTVVFKKNL